jgi:hypothetical protein
MSQKRTFVLELKNNQAITLEFSPIDATDNRLWQMFATTEALDTVQRLISTGSTVETKSARKTAPEKKKK